MRLEHFSLKQMKLLSWWCENSPYSGCDAIICDGAVRSGKTLCMSLSFVLWAFYRYNGYSFAICGKTIKNVRRNIIVPLIPLLKEIGFCTEQRLSENLLVVSFGGRINRFYIYGGKDEGSSALIQGMTLAGVMLDETALMPRSFVEQAIARCSVPGAKLWFNCNPESPYHWFYLEWIKKLKERNAYYLHFTMRDNPGLAKETILRYENMFSGAFYQRFVLGRWVKAEGLVYPFMNSDMFTAVPSGRALEYAVSIDYGTVNPTSVGLWARFGEIWYRIDEYYFDSRREEKRRTDEEHLAAIRELIGEREISFAVVDPSAASMITLMQRSGINVIKANNDVINGIRILSSALKTGKIRVCRGCRDAIREFSLYTWKKDKDEVVKENDHAMDDMRYFAAEVQRREGSFGFFTVGRRL